VRFSPKDFRQRRPNGAGGWTWKLDGVRRVLYRLDKLPGCETVCVVEGEKDADALWHLGVPATTNAGGAGKWRPEYVQQFAAANVRRVIVLPDNDDPGRAHAEAVASACAHAGLEVTVLSLPGLPPKGDVSDFLERHTKDELIGLTERAPKWQPAIPEATAAVVIAFNLTDSGNAEYFASRYGEDVRYDHRRGRWLLWRHHRWQSDADAEICRRAKAAMRQRFTDAGTIDDIDARKRAAKWAIDSESRSRLDALLSPARAERSIADAGENWDANPTLLGVPNGVIDLRTGTLRNGHRDDRITMSAATPFRSEARCPRWERFIAEAFVDRALVGFIHRAVGYSLTGDTGEQCLFLCYGTGANGKGTFTNTLSAVLGDYAYTMPFSTVEMHQRSGIPNDLAALVGRRFVGASETSDGSRLNESRLKALTGGDPMTARFCIRSSSRSSPRRSSG
jgi:putative DNA primase/helicase